MSKFNWAPAAYRLLNGVLCVFKPEGIAVHTLIRSIKMNLAKDLNALPCYKHEIPLRQTSLQENLHVKELSVDTQAGAIEDWSEHRLVLGDRYEEGDFDIRFVDGMSSRTSGVLVLGINHFGHDSLGMIAQSKFLRVYHVKGRFGWATDDFTPTGHIIERSSFKHVNKSKLERVCAAAQGNHSRQMYRLHGVNPDSQEAYEMASSGLIRPVERKSEPVLYGIRCIDFQLPDFTLEIHCINETCPYLRCLVHEFGVKLKTAAVCSGIRRLRYGYFDLQRALLRQQWHLDYIVGNIESNMHLLEPEKLFVGTEAVKTELLPVSQAAGFLSEKQHMIGQSQHLIDSSAQPVKNDNVHRSSALIREELNLDVSEESDGVKIR